MDETLHLLRPTEVFIPLSITLEAPFITQSAGAVGLGLDSATLRYNGHVALPGSLLRGNIRHALEYFVDLLDQQGNNNTATQLATNIQDWFGTKSKPAPSNSTNDPRDSLTSSVEPNRAAITFDAFFITTSKETNTAPKFRIKIDEESGRVENGMLQVIETPYLPGETVEFTGKLWVNVKEADSQTVVKWLNKALAFIPSVGTYKGIGFGKIHTFSIGEPEQFSKPEESDTPTIKNREYFELDIDRPFCVAKPHGADSNRFEAETVIPGSVIKGIVAHRFGLGANTQANNNDQNANVSAIFDKLVFSHGFPVEKNTSSRAQVIPNSVVVAAPKEDKSNTKAKYAVDIITEEPEKILKNLLIDGAAPAFATDWKDTDWELAAGILPTGMAACNKQLKISTEIAAETGAAKDEQLFSMEMVEPANLTWQFYIDASNTGESKQLLAELKSRLLQYGLNQLGKTKARAAVRSVACTDSDTLGPLKQGEMVYLVLQTPARILDDSHTVPGTGGSTKLHELYAGYFSTASTSAVSLSYFYASQIVVGGEYLHQRFQSQEPYHPIWLTESGSTFALKVEKPTEAQTLFSNWQQTGLPVYSQSLKHWSKNPYIPENGYGECKIRKQALCKEANEHD